MSVKKAPGDPEAKLSRRERQLMTILHRHGQLSAAEVREQLADPPGYSAVRSALRLLESKGLIRHHRQGQKYLFEAVHSKRKVRRHALSHLLDTFFEGSRKDAISALMDERDFRLGDEDFAELQDLLEAARRRAGEER